MIQLENEHLKVLIRPTGGELQSIVGKDTGTEYLWQGDESIWTGRAPNLFPFVGRLFEKRYTLRGASYDMTIHGFAPKAEMAAEQLGKNCCVLTLTDSEATRAIYPYRFVYRVRYELKENRVCVRYEVSNRSEEPLYCALGGHPGFRVPLEEGLKFEDYELAFPKVSEPKRVLFSERALVSGERTPYPLREGTKIPLRHDLFDEDAVVLAEAPNSVSLSSPAGHRGVRVSWEKMKYVGFWHRPNYAAPYVCIEPWSALPGRDGVLEDLEQMEDRTVVSPGEIYESPFEIEIW